jgi:hypothetical protein
MRRTAPALMALTFILVACGQPSVLQQPSVPQTQPPAAPVTGALSPVKPDAASPAPTSPAPTNPVPPAPSDPAPADPTPAPAIPIPADPAPVSPAPEEAPSLEAQGLVPRSFGRPVSVQGGTLRVGDQALFPFGFYHVSWMSDAATRRRDMLEMSAAGFNTMTASVINDADNASYGDFLDAAAQARMYVLTEGLFGGQIPKLASKPAVLGWMVADDCNLQYSAAQVRARSEATRALDPTHPTYAALFTGYGQPHADFFGATNLMGNMSYPIGPGDSIGSTYDMERLSVETAAASGTVPIANLQAFSWGTVPGHDPAARMPTPAEVYNMTYQAIGAGVKGVLYYTYIDSYNSVRRSPAVWNMVKSLVPELSQLSPMLLSAQPQYLESNNGLIHATAWVYQKHTYLLVTNVSATQAQPLYIPLAAQAPKTLRPLFAGRPAGNLKLSGTTLGGTIAPLAAHFYQIN